MTTGKNAAELEQMIAAEVAKDPNCKSAVSVAVVPSDDVATGWRHEPPPNWEALSWECKHAINAAVSRAQRDYHLLTDA